MEENFNFLCVRRSEKGLSSVHPRRVGAEMWKRVFAASTKKVLFHDTAERRVLVCPFTHITLITFLQMADFRNLISLISPRGLLANVFSFFEAIKFYLDKRLSLFMIFSRKRFVGLGRMNIHYYQKRWNGTAENLAVFNDFDFLCKFPGQYKYTRASAWSVSLNETREKKHKKLMRISGTGMKNLHTIPSN